MSSTELRRQSFPAKTIEDWHSKAEESLKGKSIESLMRNTYEQIVLKPLYSKKDEKQVSQYPSGADYRRGIYALGYQTNDWKVAQKVSYQGAEDLAIQIQEAFDKGQTAIAFEVEEAILKKNSTLSNTLKHFSGMYPFAINTKVFESKFIDILKEIAPEENICGYIANDPISLFTINGVISEKHLSEWTSTITRTHKCFPQLKTVLIDTNPYHNGGASAVQELGTAMATGVFYLEKLLSTGMTLTESLSKLIFQFSIGSNFFMEIAKLRAARVLWSRITNVYGAVEDDRGMSISAETSRFTKTVHDPHVNLLRSGNEAFAAVLGGAEYIHVEAFNSLTGSSAFSERIARNTQLLIKEEAHLKKVVDPAGGSWYIESLTNQLAEKAWTFFQQVEENGGILEALKANWLQGQISQVLQQRMKDVENRKRSIIGTNVYANLDESVPTDMAQIKEVPSFSGEMIAKIPEKRLAEPFEGLRAKAQQIKETLSEPSCVAVCLGELKSHKPRLDFVRGFLAAGGIKAIETKPLYTVEDAVKIEENQFSYFCICGTNEQYEEFGLEILRVLKNKYPEARFYLAGLPEEELQKRWLEEGITEFIHIRSNCYDTLSTILNGMEVKADEQKA